MCIQPPCVGPSQSAVWCFFTEVNKGDRAILGLNSSIAVFFTGCVHLGKGMSKPQKSLSCKSSNALSQIKDIKPGSRSGKLSKGCAGTAGT